MLILHGSTIEYRDVILEEIPTRKPYFHPDYVNIMYKAEKGGAPEFFLIKDGDDFVYYQYVRRDIAAEIEDIEPGIYYDIITPFDYGGYYYNRKSLLDVFFNEFSEYAWQTNIISEFIRFQPCFPFDYDVIEKHIAIQLRRDQVYINLKDENFTAGFKDGKRDNLRKAKNNGLRCLIKDDAMPFHRFYKETMEKRNAHNFFLFKADLLNDLVSEKLAEQWYVLKDDQYISGCILLKDDYAVYYFVAAGDPRYQSMGASTFLIYTIAEWYKGSRSIFFLGGGQGSVYDFKRGFSKCRVPYFIGYHIHDTEKYEWLAANAKKGNNGFFPRYREKII